MFRCSLLRLCWLLFAVLLVQCGRPTAVAPPATGAPTPTANALLSGDTTPTAATDRSALSAVALSRQPGGPHITVDVDVTRDVHPISPLIYGMSGAPDDVVAAVRPTLQSWGGNPSTRYNWRLGNAWNAASDWFYRNGDYDYKGASASDDFAAGALKAGMDVRMVLPTLGWVAKNNDLNTCSFPLPDGGCGDADKANCEHPGAIADPTRTSVRSTPDDVVAWVRHLVDEKGFNIRFFAMDNEPELWGYTHYDVHPTCTTYAEIRDKYLEYATAVRAVAPHAELAGPMTCCWYFYWNSAAGAADKQQHGGADFLPWFLDEVRAHDAQTGIRTLDVLDIHFYPEGLYNDQADPDTAAHRLRSTRSLWDRSYRDESWINEPIYLIPRMKELIAQHYPGVKLGISEWNWGADKTMNGALAIADVLGILGREDVYMAAYWRAPEANTPGMYAFKMYTNYDDQGSRFGQNAVYAASDQPDVVSAFAGVDPASGKLQVMLINKDPQQAHDVALQASHFAASGKATLYRYSQVQPEKIVSEPFVPGADTPLTLPPYSISLLVMETHQ